jgi:hypothetical protein
VGLGLAALALAALGLAALAALAASLAAVRAARAASSPFFDLPKACEGKAFAGAGFLTTENLPNGALVVLGESSFKGLAACCRYTDNALFRVLIELRSRR